VNATIARLTRLTAAPHGGADGPLLDAFLRGDHGAFAELVHRHAGLVFAACRRVLGHRQDAEDAFQATFLVLARRAADVWPREAVGSWLFGVAHRVALKARATRARIASRLQAHPLDEVPGAPAGAPECDAAELVQRAVAGLPPVYRAAVVACDLEGLSRKDAAARLGWSEGTLSGRLARARELLARRLRRTGLALPAAGLVLLGAPDTAPAATVRSAIDLATCATATVGAPVAALTEGLVRSMVLFKMKATAAVVFAACALGFGAFAASGSGPGGGAGDQKQSQSQSPPAPVAAKPAAEKPPAPPGARDLAPRKMTDLDRLQGTWRVVSLTENNKTTPTNPKDPWVIEVRNSTLKMPYFEGGGAGGGWKRREFRVTVEEGAAPRALTLTDGAKPVGHGIYEFTTDVASCAKCHRSGPGKVDVGDLFKLSPCQPALDQWLRAAGGELRLALSTDGKRPTTFGGDGVIVFELKSAGAEPTAEEKQLSEKRAEIEALLLKALTGDEKAKLELVKRELEAKATLLRVRKFRERALLEAEQAAARFEEAQALVELARAQLAQATAAARLAQDRLAAAEKALAEASKPAPAKPGAGPQVNQVYMVYARPQNGPEKVIRAQLTGAPTVFEGLVHAADFVTIKSDAVTVWIVRDKVVMPVDLNAIINMGDLKTKYVLKPGDQLFVQEKAKK
jgi:RNA polymerase sigma factor (sigma-70 family)